MTRSVIAGIVVLAVTACSGNTPVSSPPGDSLVAADEAPAATVSSVPATPDQATPAPLTTDPAPTVESTTSAAVAEPLSPTYLPLVDPPPRVGPDRFGPTGVALTATQLGVWERPGDGLEIVSAELSGCRLRRPGRVTYDLIAPSAAPERGVVVLGFSESLEADTGFGVGVVVDFAGPGEFSVTLDMHRLPLWSGESEMLANVDWGDIDIYPGGFDGPIGSCSSNDFGASPVEVAFDPASLEITAEEGTAEWYAQSTTLSGDGSNLLPLVYFVERAVLVGFDRIHVAPGFPLTSMTVDLDARPPEQSDNDEIADTGSRWGRCVRVTSRYETRVDDFTTVEEWFGCDPDRSVDNAALPDLSGAVTEVVSVTGSDADLLRENLVRASFAG